MNYKKCQNAITVNKKELSVYAFIERLQIRVKLKPQPKFSN